MHDAHTPRTRFRLVERTGRTAGFSSLNRLCKHLAGRHPGQDLTDLVGPTHAEADYIVRSETGEILYGVTLILAARGRAAIRHTTRPGFRAGPWPGTARRRCHRGAYYRRVRTKGALTRQDAPEDGIDEPLRPHRRRMIPSSWDDIARHSERSWKRHRANQYK